jgi:hypothetical protein
LPLDTARSELNFLHVHYLPAGATLYGTEAKVAYEYAGKTYAGRFTHMPAVNTCTGCHQPHTGEVKIDRCGGCHEGVKTVADLANIRPRLLQAMYNYTFALRDTGNAYHNGRYVAQLLYESLESLAESGEAGVEMKGKQRP